MIVDLRCEKCGFEFGVGIVGGITVPFVPCDRCDEPIILEALGIDGEPLPEPDPRQMTMEVE